MIRVRHQKILLASSLVVRLADKIRSIAHAVPVILIIKQGQQKFEITIEPIKVVPPWIKSAC